MASGWCCSRVVGGAAARIRRGPPEPTERPRPVALFEGPTLAGCSFDPVFRSPAPRRVEHRRDLCRRAEPRAPGVFTGPDATPPLICASTSDLRSRRLALVLSPHRPDRPRRPTRIRRSPPRSPDRGASASSQQPDRLGAVAAASAEAAFEVEDRTPTAPRRRGDGRGLRARPSRTPLPLPGANQLVCGALPEEDIAVDRLLETRRDRAPRPEGPIREAVQGAEVGLGGELLRRAKSSACLSRSWRYTWR